jgi:hypothetical protein
MVLVSLARAFIELAGEVTLGAVMHPANGRFGSINVVSSASRALPLLSDSGPIAASHRSATKSADARRGAAVNDELRQVAGAAALVAADERNVRWLQPQIHDNPRNQLNSRSIGDGEARSSRQRE